VLEDGQPAGQELELRHRRVLGPDGLDVGGVPLGRSGQDGEVGVAEQLALGVAAPGRWVAVSRTSRATWVRSSCSKPARPSSRIDSRAEASSFVSSRSGRS
jgi:hypothetical protein